MTLDDRIAALDALDMEKIHERFDELRAKIPALVSPEARAITEIYDALIGELYPIVAALPEALSIIGELQQKLEGKKHD